MVNLEWYRTFKAIYQTGNLTKASHELLISQPNVSIQLAALESYVGYKLFERTPRKMLPTEYGKLLYTQIVESVENLEKVESAFRKSALRQVISIRLGLPFELFYNQLINNVRDLDAYLSLSFGIAVDLTADLISDNLDFVVATQKPESSEIISIPLMDEYFYIVGPTELDSSQFDEYIHLGQLIEAEKWLLDQKWLAYNSNLALIRRFWRENFNKRPLIKAQFVVPDLLSISKLIKMGQGISVLPDHIFNYELENEGLKVLWKGIRTASNTVHLTYKQSKVTSEQLSIVKKILGIA